VFPPEMQARCDCECSRGRPASEHRIGCYRSRGGAEGAMGRRRSASRALGALLVTGLSLSARSMPAPAAPLQASEDDFIFKGFRFRNGEQLPELRMHFRTLGTPRRGPDGTIANAALLLHGTTSSGKTFLRPALADVLFAPGGPLDPAKWFIVVP